MINICPSILIILQIVGISHGFFVRGVLLGFVVFLCFLVGLDNRTYSGKASTPLDTQSCSTWPPRRPSPSCSGGLGELKTPSPRALKNMSLRDSDIVAELTYGNKAHRMEARNTDSRVWHIFITTKTRSQCALSEKNTLSFGREVKSQQTRNCKISMDQKTCAVTLEKIETSYQKNILLEFSSEKVPKLSSERFLSVQ